MTECHSCKLSHFVFMDEGNEDNKPRVKIIKIVNLEEGMNPLILSLQHLINSLLTFDKWILLDNYIFYETNVSIIFVSLFEFDDYSLNSLDIMIHNLNMINAIYDHFDKGYNCNGCSHNPKGPDFYIIYKYLFWL